ncbi:hypothetical protein MRS44_008930 [Fusarium solani]|uniref:Cytochrome P450 n=1 Tax=Fusarium solani TaxID=169388 RepID=A0A9P9HMX3_FUSSL|nr:cytochrome P450 [Fusarium solani]KAH7260296.1 cytochrome P450 [Fusarium solani]KAJ3464144.1 hypothetical protein MRS44_008930 [Fusarium solani]
MTPHYFLDKLPHVHAIPLSHFNPLSLPVLLAIVLILVSALLLQACLATRRPKDFPPGPPTTPFLGNILDVPLSKPCVTFAKWAQIHGPILGIKAGPMNMVVLHDPDDIHELYDRRGSTYAGRPYNYIALNHVFEPDIGQIYLFQRNDRLLKRWKRPARWFLSQQGIEGIMPILDAVGARCIKALCDSPSQFLKHLRVWAFSTPLIVLSGQAHINQDLLRTYFYRQQLVTRLLEPGKTPPVDFIAPLRWLPTFLAKWKREAYFVRKHQDAFYGEMLAGAASNRQRRKDGDKNVGEYEPVMARLLGEGMPEREVKWLAGGLLDAAFDTTSAAVANFVVALAGHANVLKRAREEMEAVCEGRMPTGEDVGKMPYLKACLMETFRWRPPAPLGLPHVTDSDDTYKGYLIPRGTNIIVNAFAILHNPDVHPNPTAFDPTRYLDPEKHTDEHSKSTWIFGAGRRRCVGDQYTIHALMAIMAKMVWALDMKVPEGTDLSVEGGFDDGLMMKARENVTVEFEVRDGRRERVEEEWQKGERELERMLGKC